MFTRALVGACLVSLTASLITIPSADAATPSAASAMRSAAASRSVPLVVIEAIAYVNTGWEWIPGPASDGGVGPMNIRPEQQNLAASLSGHTPAAIQADLAPNIDAGAALLAYDHPSGSGLESWRPAVAAVEGTSVASEVFSVLASGASRTTSTGETITLTPQAVSATGPSRALTASGATDFPGATWIPANTSNYTVANRPDDYPIDMIIIHDIEGSYGSAIQDFQTLGFAASAHYVVSYQGQVAQMVREKDVAWHAGNWDYNTRAIGIEHEGFAYTPGLYTTAEYNASAAIAASICERYGVPLDRNHVIGHYQVPDPNNPGLFGGVDHHTDPGPYWNWTYYMAQAQADAATLPSPPRMMPDAIATNGLTSATVTWQPARTCRPSAAPMTGYTVVAQPGNITVDVPASKLSYTFQNLTPETTYTFTVTAHNAYGSNTIGANPATPGRCASLQLAASPSSPQPTGSTVQLTTSSTGCANPLYQFWVLPPNSSTWQKAQGYSTSPTLTWRTTGDTPGNYVFSVWAQDAASVGGGSNFLGTWDAYQGTQYTLQIARCSSVTANATPANTALSGTPVVVSAIASGCPSPQFQFWLLAPGSTAWKIVQPYSTVTSHLWSSTGGAAGTYTVAVWAKDVSSPGANSGGLGRWDSLTSFRYALTSQPCTGLTIAMSPSSPAPAGTSVTITATASGCGLPQYEAWVLAPGSSTWKLLRAYGSSPTITWTTTAAARGVYHLSIWARDASSAGTAGGSLGTWDIYQAPAYSLS